MEQLPPIFKVANKLDNHNQKYFQSNSLDSHKEIKKEESLYNNLTIIEKIEKIFKTTGYAFNIPVKICFSNKEVNTYLALKKNNSIITLDNEVIPISLITSLEIKSPSVE